MTRYAVTGIVETHKFPRARAKIRGIIESCLDVEAFLTGAAYGVDTIAAHLALDHWGGQIAHEVFAPVDQHYNQMIVSLMASNGAKIHYIEGSYMDRNEALVATADVLLAFPDTKQEVLRSGTWATVRRARKRNIPVRIYSLGGR